MTIQATSLLYGVLKGDTAMPTTFALATVKALPPNISLRIDGQSQDTPKELIVLAEQLTEHKRKVNYVGGSVSGAVTPSGSLTSLTLSDGEITIKSPLKVGDRVICVITNDGQLVYVLDKAVI